MQKKEFSLPCRFNCFCVLFLLFQQSEDNDFINHVKAL